MSPAFRDLKGRPVEEVVTSRDVPPEEVLAEREAIRQAAEKVQASKGTTGRTPEWRETTGNLSGYVVYDPDREQPPFPRAELPEDVETALKVVEESLREVDELTAVLRETTARVRVEMQAVRARAVLDHERLSKLQKLHDVLKSIED